MNDVDEPGLYVHVPFCMSKCRYCDFYSVTSLAWVRPWLEATQKEMLLTRGSFGTFDTLHLGGGTPSLLHGSELSALVDQLFKHFDFSADTEFTIEVNPDDVTSDKLKTFKDLGVNRISLGVQSFNGRELSWLGRRHTAGQAEKAIELIRSAGFQNLAIDLIYGFQGQTKTRWLDNLERALAFRPEHLSCYMLTVEEGTPFGTMKAEGRIAALSESEESRLFLLTSDVLEGRGYIHYEVSNFARGDQHVSRHNRKYWNHTPYLGIGPAAHSFREGARSWNVRSVEEYCTRIARGGKPMEGSEELTAEQLELEALYFGFRTQAGVDMRGIRKTAHMDAALHRLSRSGLIEIKGDRVAPTRRGYLFSDALPLELLD